VELLATDFVAQTTACIAASKLCHIALLTTLLTTTRSIVGEQAPAANFSKTWQSTLGLSNSQVSSLQSKAQTCGYTNMLNQIVRDVALLRRP
jgi:carboxypeptidase D